MWDKASKGIGAGLGMIGVGIGLRFMSDTVKDLRIKNKRPRPPKTLCKPFKWK